MNKINFSNNIKLIISKILKVNIKNVKLDSSAKDFKYWDSLNNIKIFLEIQKKIKKIHISDYTKCKKIGDIVNLIKK